MAIKAPETDGYECFINYPETFLHATSGVFEKNLFHSDYLKGAPELPSLRQGSSCSDKERARRQNDFIEVS